MDKKIVKELLQKHGETIHKHCVDLARIIAEFGDDDCCVLAGVVNMLLHEAKIPQHGAMGALLDVAVSISPRANRGGADILIIDDRRRRRP